MIRRVLVTGAGSGIGLATALRLAREGFEVHALVRGDQERKELEAAEDEAGVSTHILAADLADPADRSAIGVEALDLWALVNNAGYMNAGDLRDIEVEVGRRQLEVMVVAPIDLARRALPAMIERGNGRIVNVTSAASHTATPLTGWYGACKAALRELSDSLRMELRDSGVEVIDIEPGGMQTNIWPRARSELLARQRRSQHPERYERVLENMGRFEDKMASPDKVADVIADSLLSGRTRAHRRVGHDSIPLRLLSEVLPDGLVDKMAAYVERTAS